MVRICPKHDTERGRSGNCSQCHKEYYDAHKDAIRLYRKRWDDEHKEKIRLKQKKWKDANRKRVRLYDKKWRDTHQEEVRLLHKNYYNDNKEEIKLYHKKRLDTPIGRLKSRARSAVQYAIKKGKLVKLPCQVCGNPKSDAHHYLGYSKEHRLDVVFLCRTHHAIVDKELKSKAPVV